jgi:hypothetical protein
MRLGHWLAQRTKYIANRAASDLGIDAEEFTAHRIGDILRTLGFEPLSRTNRGILHKITKEKTDRTAWSVSPYCFLIE